MHAAFYRAILGGVKRLPACLLLLQCACSEPAMIADAGDAGTEDAARPLPEGPNAAALPAEVAPIFPDGRRDDCPFDRAHFPGTTDCTLVGSECPADGWPSDLPADRPIIYVDDEASGDGTSRASPYRSINFAASQAPAGAIVAIATGRYDELVLVRRPDVTLWGACVGGTRLTTSMTDDSRSHVYLGSDGVTVKNLGIDAPERIGLLFDGVAHLEDVVVSGARLVGLIGNNGGRMTARRIVVRGTRALPGGELGYGVQINGGSSLVIEDSVIEHHSGLGLSANQVGVLEARRVVVHDITPSNGDLGLGVWIAGGSTGTIEQVAVTQIASRALFVEGEGTVVTARDVITEDSAGFQIIDGGRLLLERAKAEVQRGAGFHARDVATTVEVRDLIIRDGSDSGDLLGRGHGIAIERATAVMERVLVDRCQTVGIQVVEGAHFEARDITVLDTKADVAGTRGEGFAVTTGASATVERMRLERNREVSFLAADPGSTAAVTDLSVIDTIPREDGEGGPGVWAQIGGSISLTRARIERSTFVGLAGLQAHVLAEDVVILGVARAPCAETTCPDTAGGFGIAAHYGGSVGLNRFTIEEPAICGAVVGAASSLGDRSGVDLAHGTIARTPIGACVQLDDFDSARLRNDVEYRDVDVPLQSTSYGLPDTLSFE